ncbi:hypothetical protein QJS10_CPB11g02280 [Acorus calamus]|uniref:Transmembrane protein n=1 Tax=Acorus calamus TaxID=4465 RepID=A0AAV9DVF6_ACOCL|nr:hypothetical protein QJS10_CPB11g02280 [Acorus calamus]
MSPPSITHSLLLIIVATLSIFIGGAQSRPCKTLFISYTATVSSTSSSLTISGISSDPSDPRPPSFLAVYSVIRPFRPSRPMLIRRPQIARSDEALPASSAIVTSSSLRERTRDILSVVVALLFGAGCGALTSATIYLAWSLLAHNRYDDADFSDEDDEIESPKKMGYFQIPTETAVAAKEGYEGK